MANPSPVSFTLDPTVPLGSESLKAGPSRIRAIPTSLLDFLGFTPDTAVGTALSPIQQILFPGVPSQVQLQAWNDPTDALAYATKRYTDRRTVFLNVSGLAAGNYSVSDLNLPAMFPLDSNAVYIFANGAGTFDNMSGPASLTINTTGPIAIVRADASPLASGDIVAGAIYLFTFDPLGNRFRKMDFIGGTITQPLILDADPTVALGAATKQYVDHVVNVPAHAVIPATVALPVTGGGLDLMSLTVNVPADGSYLLACDYAVYVNNGQLTNVNNAYLWVTDGAQRWAAAGMPIYGGSIQVDAVVGASGLSPAVYPPSSVVNVHVRAIARGTLEALVTSSLANAAAVCPPSYFSVALVKSHA